MIGIMGCLRKCVGNYRLNLLNGGLNSGIDKGKD